MYKDKTLFIVIPSVVGGLVLLAALYLFWQSNDAEQDVNSALSEIKLESSVAPPPTNPLKAFAPESAPGEKTNPFQYENPFK